MHKIVITVKDNIIYYGLFDERGPLELYISSKEEKPQVGNIYAARVENLAAGIQGAFVKVSENQKCFYRYGKDNTAVVNLTRKNNEKICTGDIILVQIIKESAGEKLPVVSDNISIHGAYFVLSIADKRLSISKKIKDKDRRTYLQSLMEKASDERKNAFGLVARTKAEEVDESLLEKDITYLLKTYDELMRKASFSFGAELIYEEPAHFVSFAREIGAERIDEIVVDDPSIAQRLRSYYESIGLEEVKKKIRLYQEEYALYSLYRMEHFYEKARNRKVYLKSGGSLVIDKTEAMTVIDVNSGALTKRQRNTSLFYKINKEAADEIIKQCRLRNLSGIILIDFINMSDVALAEDLLNYIRKNSMMDRNPVKVVDITKLGLVELTRERKMLPLSEQWNRLKNSKESC